MAVFSIVISRHIELFRKHKSGILYMVCLVGFLGYVAAGSSMFFVLEADEFEESQKAVIEAKDKIRKKYPQLSGKSWCFLIL